VNVIGGNYWIIIMKNNPAAVSGAGFSIPKYI
jgi:hypothetical protein